VTSGSARIAYENFNYLENINPNYKDSSALMSDAHYRGTDFVFIQLDNHTDHIIPKELESDLLQIDTYKMNELWTVYHSAQVENTDYDYELIVAEAEYRSYQNKQVITSFPIVGEYNSFHHYCTHNGDRRALDDHYRGLLGKALVSFPSNEQMIYGTGENLKHRLKEIVAANQF